MTTITVHCPECGTPVQVRVTVLSMGRADWQLTWDVDFRTQRVNHACPDPTTDAKPLPSMRSVFEKGGVVS